MTEQDRFEHRLETRIHAYVAPAGVDFDAAALTRAAVARGADHPWLGWMPVGHAARPILLALIGLVGLLLTVGGLIAASRLLDHKASDEPQGPGSFATTGAMSVARYWHTAVRLADGRVLIIGGFPQVPPNDNDPPAPADVLPAEIYDPATEMFTSVPALSLANQGASATILRDGRVLIAGGRTRGSSPHPRCMTTCRLSGTALDTAVLFDPRTSTVTPVGALSVPRFDHAAVLLNDGRVLLAGGRTGSVPDLDGTLPPPLASAELFDPATNSFTLAGSLAEGVAPDMQFTSQVSATVLPDGRALVADQIFDPLTGIFHVQTAGDRMDPGTTPDGVSAGSPPVIRYLTDYGQLVAFDPEGWEASGGDLPSLIWKPDDAARGVIATMLADGRVLWTGGVDGAPDAWIGDPLTHGSEPTGPLGTPRLGHTATLLSDGRVLVVGGWTAGERIPQTSMYTSLASLASAELYLPPPRPPLLREVP
jgi:hypothetical protein